MQGLKPVPRNFSDLKGERVRRRDLDGCPIAGALQMIGDKWTMLIIRDLANGPKRTMELHSIWSRLVAGLSSVDYVTWSKIACWNERTLAVTSAYRIRTYGSWLSVSALT